MIRFRLPGWERESRNEFQTLIALLLLLSGVSQVIMHHPPQAIAQVNPVLQHVWAWTLFLAPLFTLAGAFWPDEGHGLWMELAGMLSVGFLATGYGVAVIAANPVAAVNSFGGPLILAVAAACFRRCLKIKRRIWIPEAEHNEAVKRAVVEMALSDHLDGIMKSQGDT